MQQFGNYTDSKPAANSTLAIGEVSSPLDSFVVAESSVVKSPPIANLLIVSRNPTTDHADIS